MDINNQDIEFAYLKDAVNDEQYNVSGEAEMEAAAPDTSEIIEPLLQMGFGVLAPNWGVVDDEIHQLAIAYGGLMDKYLPDGVGKYSVEIGAVMVTAAVVLPRLKIPRKAEMVDQPEPERTEDEQRAAA